MSKQETSMQDELNSYVPRPEQGAAKRHMLAVDKESYAFITEMADTLKTTRGRVVTALVKFYQNEEGA
jgi:hypothetical protein